ncbi:MULTISPECIES: hypothetical protein [unclassified Streptomyces]|uniref:hypothetical protein n=1 Tax=unclassified Streptomyces TaxID=2593676 RepID=UPI00093BAC73|nr:MULTISPECIES: hypothetical protein [unclassified Streptomyces]OKK14835.1 hypothetical protein AMK09_25900 [Streptomyces sp. CB02488]WSJ21609.1 hypothetical protein OG384_06180 [Streptomyces sp. NBC_01324]
MSEDQPVPVEDAENPASTEGPESPESPAPLESPASAGDALDGGSGRPSFVRRLLRSRTARAVTAAGLAGVLLGAGAVAWRTDTLPLLGPAPCWDSLGDASVSGLFGDRRIEVDEQSLGNARQGDGLSYGQCRITSFKDDRALRQVTVNVHQLDGLRGTDSARWPQEFLAAGMVSLGEGLPGMVSASRGWLALPQGCTGRGDFSGPTVVEIAMGRAGLDFSSDLATEDRDALTDALVEAANGVIRSFGCSGRYPSPRSLPSVDTWQDTDAAALCGAKGFALPSAYRKELSRTRTGAGDDGPARICEVGSDDREQVVRMTTVVDPALAEVFSWDALRSGASLKGTTGYGKTTGGRAVYRARCQTGPVVFVVEQLRQTAKGGFTLTDELLPGYVAAEAERIGCGPQKLTLPSA